MLQKLKKKKNYSFIGSVYKTLSGTSTGNMHVYQVTGLKLKEFDVKFSPEEENKTTEIEKETTKVDEH